MFAGYPLAGAPFAGEGQSNIAIEVSGVSANIYLASVKTGIGVQPTSVTGQVSLGTAVAQANADVPVTGVEASTSVGNVTVYLQKFVYPVGVEAANDVGTVEVDAKANVTVTGLSATGSLGEADSAITVDVSVTGISATTSLASVATSADSNAIVYVDQPMVMGLGEVIPSSDNIITVTGFQLTTGLGDEGVRIVVDVDVSGVYGTSELGTVEVDSKATVYVTGVSARGGVSTPLVWGIIDTTQNPNWVPIAA